VESNVVLVHLELPPLASIKDASKPRNSPLRDIERRLQRIGSDPLFPSVFLREGVMTRVIATRDVIPRRLSQERSRALRLRLLF
jgi:hypothetical protein